MGGEIPSRFYYFFLLKLLVQFSVIIENYEITTNFKIKIICKIEGLFTLLEKHKINHRYNRKIIRKLHWFKLLNSFCNAQKLRIFLINVRTLFLSY